MSEEAALGVRRGTSPPFATSPLDRMVDALDRVPGPPAAAYLGLAAVIVLALHLAAAIDGTVPVGRVSPELVSFGLWGPLILAAKAFVRGAAGRAADAFARALDDDAEARERARYRLTRQPALGTWVAGAVVLGISAPSTFLNEHYVLSTGLFTSTGATVLHAPLIAANLWITGAAGFGVLHQLRVIRDLYATATHVDVLRPEPLYALSRVASFAAVAVLLVQYTWIAGNPAVLRSPAAVTNLLGWDMLVVALFVWPLWGAHRRLAAAKAELLTALRTRATHASEALQAALDARETQRLGPYKDALLGLEASVRMFEKTSTWPWNPETPRLVGSALLLPLAAWLLQRLVDRAFLS